MERLHLLDAEFLYLEDAAAPMHIACISVFEGPAPGEAEVLGLFRAKLHLIPRYRQRIRFPPLELGRPVWVDDPHFDLAYHVRRTALPRPHDDRQLCELMGRLMSQPLDRDRALWEAWFVEGLKGGRWALISKIHHCMVDGISGIDLLAVLLDLERDVPLPEPVAWAPAPEPPGVALVLDAWRGLAGDASSWLRKLGGNVRDPLAGARALLETAEGLVEFALRAFKDPKSSVVGTIGCHRVYAHTSVSLAEVGAIRNAFGCKVNDVVLSAITAGLRALMLHRGEHVGKAGLRSLVPVSVRTAEARGVTDNRVSALLCDLPVDLDEPLARLRSVTARMAELKRSHMASAGEWVTEVGDLAPPMVVSWVSRFVTRVMHQVPQRTINTVTTNVPGPPFRLYCLGRAMLECLPYVPIAQGVRVGTAALSYAGRISFGVTGDYDSARDVGVVTEAIHAEVALLHRLARPEPRRRRAAPAKRPQRAPPPRVTARRAGRRSGAGPGAPRRRPP